MRKSDKMEIDDNLDEEALPSLSNVNLTKVSEEKIKKMTEREFRVEGILYPEDVAKTRWDVFLTIILISTCIITPYRIAFGPQGPDYIGWRAISYFFDFCFLIDMIILFNTAYYNDEYQIVEDRTSICCEYLKGWFTIDLLAIIPFDDLMGADTGNAYRLGKLTRVSKLPKVIKLTRLLRILKIIKERTKLLKYLNDVLKLGLGYERLIFFSLISIIMIHSLSCIWIVVADIAT